MSKIFNCLALLTILNPSMVLLGVLNSVEVQKQVDLPLAEVEAVIKKLDNLEALESLGWSSYHVVLPRIINERKLKVGAEVGVSCGLHSYKILEYTNLEKLYSVDPYRSYGDSTNVDMPQKHFDIMYLKVKDKLSKFGNRTKMIRDLSKDASPMFKKHELDFVFLDANHQYEFVKEDLNLWYEKVRPGGIVAGDDYATIHPGVPQAVDEFFAEKNIEVMLDKTPDLWPGQTKSRFWWVIKPLDAKD